jgi:hypothetical protein
MPPPSRRYRVDRIRSGQLNGETVNQGMLVWFRDKASFDVIVDAFADKYGYETTMTMPTGQVRVFDGTKAEFFELTLSRILKSTVVEYRQRLAERKSVEDEIAELPD